jgi:hypothetical protein
MIAIYGFVSDWVTLSKIGGKDGVSKGWQGCYEGFPEVEA